jgi:hypothetical protein
VVFSWNEPVLELSFEALEHLFFDAFDVSELAPPSHITVFRRALNLYDKLFHQSQLVWVFFPEMLFANVSSLFLPVLSPQTHRRFKVAGVNDCRDVSPLFRWQAYYRRQHLSRHLGRRSSLPHPKRPPDLQKHGVEWPFSCTASFSVFSPAKAKLPII